MATSSPAAKLNPQAAAWTPSWQRQQRVASPAQQGAEALAGLDALAQSTANLSLGLYSSPQGLRRGSTEETLELGEAKKDTNPRRARSPSPMSKYLQEVKKQRAYAVLERVPMEIWLRIIGEVVFDDVDYARLARARSAEPRFFPHVKTLSLVNRAFHNAANHLKDYIVTVTNATDAAAFIKKNEDGLATRVLSVDATNIPMHKADVLSAACGVEHLILGPMTLNPAQLTIPELRDVKTLHLFETELLESKDVSPSPSPSPSPSRPALPFALDKFRVAVDWHTRYSDAGFYANILLTTSDTISLKLDSRLSDTDANLPKLSKYFVGLSQPLPLSHLTLLTSHHDRAILNDLEPFLRQCHSLTSLYTSLAGENLKAMLRMLPATVRLTKLRLTVAGCHFEDTHTWRNEKKDLGGAACETECDIVRTVPALYRLKHLVVEERGTQKGRDALLAVCSARRTWLKWTANKRIKSHRRPTYYDFNFLVYDDLFDDYLYYGSDDDSDEWDDEDSDEEFD